MLAARSHCQPPGTPLQLGQPNGTMKDRTLVSRAKDSSMKPLLRLCCLLLIADSANAQWVAYNDHYVARTPARM
jgi:hypothetical protein